jgi:Spy/CpxP family protein refolding chaperone
MASQISRALLVLFVAFGIQPTAELAASEHVQQRAADQVRQSDSKDQKPSSTHQRTAWWKDEKARAEIGLTVDQSAEIDRIFKNYIERAKPLREEVSTLEKALSETMKANTAHVSVVEQQVDKVENRRAELNKLRVVMLYRMHRVLSPEQNGRFQAYMDRREAERKKQDGDRHR